MDTTESAPHPNGDRLSVAEAAELLGVHSNTVRHRLRKGHYHYEQVVTPYGPAYAILRSDVEADLAAALHPPHNGVGANNGATPHDTEVMVSHRPVTDMVAAALAPLVDELVRARADAAAAHERAGRLEAERDAAVLERNVERTRRYELEQRRPWWRFW